MGARMRFDSSVEMDKHGETVHHLWFRSVDERAARETLSAMVHHFDDHPEPAPPATSPIVDRLFAAGATHSLDRACIGVARRYVSAFASPGGAPDSFGWHMTTFGQWQSSTGSKALFKLLVARARGEASLGDAQQAPMLRSIVRYFAKRIEDPR